MQWFIKQHQLTPAMPFDFTAGGVPIDLTGKSVKFTMTLLEATSPSITNAACTINSPNTLGTGYYPFQAGQTEVVGHYLVEWYIPELNERLPVVGYDDLFISASLA